MKLLNLGCGSTRPPEPWVNLDNLRTQLCEGTPEREALDNEPNYIEHDVAAGALPFDEGSFDGVIASHFFEHFDAQEGVRIMRECHRVLRKGGVMLVSVPDASYFRFAYPEDNNSNWPRLFEVSDPNNPIPTFFEAALWFEQHKAILTEDALWCYLTRAGFSLVSIDEEYDRLLGNEASPVFAEMFPLLNRRIFSLEMLGVK